MTTRRDFFTNLFTDPMRLFRNPQIRDVVLNDDRQFVDVQLDKRIGDPLHMDDKNVRKKLILVNFFSSRYDEELAAMRNLAEIARKLGNRLNREVFINSVTVDPEHDTAERLEELAGKLEAPYGWTFVRATGDASKEIEGRMNRVRGYTSRKEVFYGTPGGFWGTFPASNSPEEVADRLSRSIPGPRPKKLRRAGPARRGEEKYPWSARAV